MTTLARSFESDLQAALVDSIEAQARDTGRDFINVAQANWVAYAARNGYSIEHIWTDVEGPHIERTETGVEIRVEWPGLTALFEWGVDPHTIDGNPMLHFYYDAIDQWIQTESVDWGSETGGIPESRAIRDAETEIMDNL